MTGFDFTPKDEQSCSSMSWSKEKPLTMMRDNLSMLIFPSHPPMARKRSSGENAMERTS